MDKEDKISSTICRVCLEIDVNKGFSILESCNNGVICDLINSIANIHIRKNDGFPDIICTNCLNDLQTAIDFKLKCESSDIILRSATLSNCAKLEPKYNFEVEIKEEKLEVEETFEQYPEEEDFESFDTTASLKCLITKNEHGILETSLINRKSSKSKEKDFKSKAIGLKLICDDCGGSFKSKCKLRVHWKRVHLTEKLECSICKRVFKSMKAFNRHKKVKSKSCMAVQSGNFKVEGSGKARVYICNHCDYKTQRNLYMQTHTLVHSGERPFKCKICPQSFTQLSTLHGHEETAHKFYKVECTCPYCGKHVKGRGPVYAHLRTHRNESVQCDVCRKTYKNKRTLEMHMKRHSGVKSITCEHCAYRFYTNAELANHRRRYHAKEKHYYFCDKCSYKSVNHTLMKKHKSKHTDTNIPCCVCGMFFIEISKMLAHQKQHFEEKKNECQYCNQKFYRRDTLVRHIRKKHDVENMSKVDKPNVKTTLINVAAASNQKLIAIKLFPEDSANDKINKLLKN